MATAQSVFFDTDNIVMTGTAQAMLIPFGIVSALYHANGGDVTFETAEHHAASIDKPMTLASGCYLPWPNTNLQGTTFYVNGTSGVILEILYEKGNN